MEKAEEKKIDNILVGRKSKCCICGNIRDSSEDLPLFVYQPVQKFDSLFDACLEWI